MKTKQQNNEQVKTQAVTSLPVVTLSMREMAVVSGGSKSSW